LLTLFILLYFYGGDDYLVNLKVVSETTKRRDFTVIFPIFSKMPVILPIFYRDFLTALATSHALAVIHTAWSVGVCMSVHRSNLQAM